MTAPTPSQTIGPFFAVALPELAIADDGDVVVHGYVLDGDDKPVDDAMIELWHASGDGRLDPGVFRRAFTDRDGHYAVRTTPPGRAGDGAAPPHIDVSLFARGLLQRLVTRIYLDDDVAASDATNGADAVLAAVEPGRRRTLIAARDQAGYRFDVHLQGEQETVFFAW